MSALNYVAVYHQNGMTTIHSFASWDHVREEFSDPTERMVSIPNPYGGISLIFRGDMESVHLVTEEEAEWSTLRQAAFEELDQKNRKDWK